MDKLSYGLGLGIGQQLASMNIEQLNLDDFMCAIKDILDNNELKVNHREAQEIVQQYFMKKEQEMQKEREEKGKLAKKEGEEFLKANAQKPDVITRPSGLQYMVLKEGTGKSPKASDTVKCHYEGFLIDGTVFDSSVQRGEPATFPLNQVIAGWTEGLQLMSIGSKYKLYIPYQLGYGERGAGAQIPPYSTLIFTVELLGIE